MNLNGKFNVKISSTLDTILLLEWAKNTIHFKPLIVYIMKKKVFNNQFFWLFYYYSSASNQLLQFCEIASLVQQSQALPETILSNNKHDLM